MTAFIPPSPFLGIRPCPPRRRPRPPRRRPRPCLPTITASASADVVIIGAGVAGLSTAYELAQKGASVQILTSLNRKPAANASAGMLAPNAEDLPGDMCNLCRISREMYPDFVRRLERLVNLDVNYVSRNDFLIPSMSPLSGPDVLTAEALRHIEPALGPKVEAARRSPGDASVDSRRLMNALYKACVSLGVKIDEGTVQSIIVEPNAKSVDAVQTNTGRVTGGHFLVASGAWTAKLLPEIPIKPVKGQMLSLAPPDNDSLHLNHVLYGHDVYIVPKNGGNEFYVGATVEHTGFDSKITAGGISHLLHSAIDLVPNFANYEIRETWSGLRPATPDLLPVLGHSEYRNVTIASGYYRNGVLLAPAASSIAAAFALGEVDFLPSNLRELAHRFSYKRLLESSDKVDVEMREDAEMPPKDKPKSPQNMPKESAASSDMAVMLWKVNKDGTTEPVYPSRRFLESRGQPNHGPIPAASVSNSISPVSESPAAFQQASISDDDGVYQGGEGFQSIIENPENVSGENDAYEDVMRKRAIADEVMSQAMAANRAFGRTKSSLETDGSKQLSISEEEVAAFDEALNRGIEDMKELEKHFDQDDPSVRATRAEKEMLDFHAGDSGLPLNGVVVPSFAKGQTTNESLDGYF